MTRLAATRALMALLGLLLGPSPALADAAEPPSTLRVGTSGDYAPFSFDPAGPAPLDGLDVALARAFAEERGLRLELVPFAWPDLARRFENGDFDVVMSGVTVRPERSLAGSFTAPIIESGAVVLVRTEAAPASLEALDDKEVTLAVNAGGHLLRAARARFPAATVVAVAGNEGVLDELVAGRARGAVTDTLEAPAWEARAPGLTRLGPFTQDRKAWLVRAGQPALSEALDDWLAARETDGTLAKLRARWVPGSDPSPTASPLPALVAALDERLSLMPFVAEAKRALGRPVRDLAQEARVLEVATTDVRAAANGRAPKSEVCVRGLYQAQIDAGSAIQEVVLAREPSGLAPAPDLERVIRPALARIGRRIATDLAELPDGLDEETIRTAVRTGLRTPDLDVAEREAIASALARCARLGP